ncbi:MAG: hypothetical protein L3I99_02550 [Sulfurimonas sp.]|nr:hypothetical protein [Sulfurimonas sp.]
MKKIVKMSLAVAMISGLGAVNAQAADSADGVNILSDIKVVGQIRPRLEMVDDGNSFTDDATAFTARTKLTASANLFEIEGLTSTLGMISVNNFGATDYNQGGGGHGKAQGNGAYSVVLDPQDAMLSEASLDYTVGKTALHIGRSNINLDNQRFIGTVGWRQLERSYDTVYAANSDVENLSVLAAYVYGFAGVGSVETADTKSILLHAAYDVMPELKVTAYGYLLASIHDTYGLALTGTVDVGTKLTYRAEYAIQGDATMEMSDAPGNADASYMNIDVGTNISGILVGLNYEVLSGADSGDETAFSTPLGTNHKFNGWADKFLGTPAGGLNDLNIRVGYKAKGFGKILVKYHMFTSDVGSDDYGTEINAVYVNKIPGVKGLNGLVKYANYSADTYSADTTKIWLGVDYKF